MKSVYDPDNDDVLEWLSGGQDRWPASDWDFYVMGGKNDDLVLRLANDAACEQRDFFVHALYYLVGDYTNEGQRSPEKRARIERLLALVDRDATRDVRAWKRDTGDLLRGDLKFDIDYWLHHFIHEER